VCWTIVRGPSCIAAREGVVHICFWLPPPPPTVFFSPGLAQKQNLLSYFSFVCLTFRFHNLLGNCFSNLLLLRTYHI